jgi:hypothetical protein
MNWNTAGIVSGAAPAAASGSVNARHTGRPGCRPLCQPLHQRFGRAFGRIADASGEAMPTSWNLAGLIRATPAAARSSDDAHHTNAVLAEPHPLRLAGWAGTAVDPGMVRSSGPMTDVPIARPLPRSMTMRPAVDRVPQTSR